VPYINDAIAGNQKHNEDLKPRTEDARPSRFRFCPDEVIRLLKARIIGQTEMQDSIADLLHVVKADFSESGRPLGISLFVGSTGVGKTETVRVLAEAILGDADQLCRIDMNTLAQEHYTAALTGAPPGYVGSKEHHTLFNPEKIAGSYSRPGIVMFDEIEKASRDVARALLNVLDSGTLELAAGTKRLDFKNCLIFMTSNEGARELDAYRRKFQRGWRKWLGASPSTNHEKSILDAALQKKFDLEFINRIDRIIYFEELGSKLLDDILNVELAMLDARLSRQQIALEVDASARAHLVAGHDKRFGARHLRRKLRTYLEPPLARALRNEPGRHRFHVTCREGVLVVVPE